MERIEAALQNALKARERAARKIVWAFREGIENINIKAVGEVLNIYNVDSKLLNCIKTYDMNVKSLACERIKGERGCERVIYNLEHCLISPWLLNEQMK